MEEEQKKYKISRAKYYREWRVKKKIKMAEQKENDLGLVELVRSIDARINKINEKIDKLDKFYVGWDQFIDSNDRVVSAVRLL